MIDTHCHLSHPDFEPDREAVISRSWTQGVTAILEVGYSVLTSRFAVALARQHPDRIRAAVGIHPHEAGTAGDADFAAVEALLSEPEVIAIGETGLDFYRDWAPRDRQLALFRRTVNLARERGLPVVVHDRDAHEDVLGIIEAEGRGEVRGIFHCFSGDAEVARRAMDLGFCLGLGGSITYMNPRKTRGQMLAELPLERLVLETDAPWLSPEPEKGARNEPARMRHVVARLAELQGRDERDIVRATSENVSRLFAHAAPWPPREGRA
ncbi:MAG TPA: TatD family hydrolase, partial [Candidatus Eisenbacteria bacterium]|nr:TatD family hydrolase [Candidatus Eisenbacteria bacterium]